MGNTIPFSLFVFGFGYFGMKSHRFDRSNQSQPTHPKKFSTTSNKKPCAFFITSSNLYKSGMRLNGPSTLSTCSYIKHASWRAGSCISLALGSDSCNFWVFLLVFFRFGGSEVFEFSEDTHTSPLSQINWLGPSTTQGIFTLLAKANTCFRTIHLGLREGHSVLS